MLVRELFVAKSKRSEVTMASCTKKKKKKNSDRQFREIWQLLVLISIHGP